MANETRAEQSRDRELWRRSRMAEGRHDESELFLDLAGFVEGRLDADDNERIVALLHADPTTAGDVAAARDLRHHEHGVASDAIIARGCAVVASAAPQTATIIGFPRWRRAIPTLPPLAQWASLAAAVVVASWLGFAMGSNTSAVLGEAAQAGDDGFLHEFLDPSIGFMRDLTEGTRT